MSSRPLALTVYAWDDITYVRTQKGFVYTAFVTDYLLPPDCRVGIVRFDAHQSVAATGTVSDPYDNALAENVNGSYKNELIHTRRWVDVVEVEIVTFEWVN